MAHLETLPNEALHEQMRALLGPESVTRYETLQAIRAERRLTKAEQQEWESLRSEADGLVYCKAYAAVLLKWRGERIPTLAELETQHQWLTCPRSCSSDYGGRLGTAVAMAERPSSSPVNP